MSGPSVKIRSARVSTTGSVDDNSSHKIKKPSGGAKLLGSGATFKSGGSGRVVGQFNSMDTNGEASEEKEEEVSLPPHMSFSLDKVWVDPKIIKTQVEVAMKKSFTLDINLSAVEKKSATAKTQVIRKLFSGINGFGGAITPSKFEGIIRSMFTSSESMEKAESLARANNIIVNNNLKRQGVCSDRAIVIKEISMNMPKGNDCRHSIRVWSSSVNPIATHWAVAEDCGGVCQIKSDRLVGC
ncbi:hypothetical protein G9A89_010147 [Geosiphon pyriformis]|nr:hypothetical protein G9A89_010147 [Geosiphon pyriformis]